MKNWKFAGHVVVWGVVLLLCLVLITRAVRGEEVTISWDNPVAQETCTDGGPLTDLKGVKVYELVGQTMDPALTEVTLTGYKPGEYRFVATAYVLDADGNEVESRTTASVTKTVTSFAAPAGATVYQVVTITNDFLFLPVGTVSADTECITSVSVKGKYPIPTTAVSWSPGTTVRPVLVVTDCE